MNLPDFVSQNTNQKLLYPGQAESLRGQCVQLVMLYMKQVQGVEPPIYPDAKDYFNNIPGYSAVQNPQDGDIAVYRGHDSFPEGHIAVVYNNEVFEQNADPDGSPAHLYARSTVYLLGYMRKDDMIQDEEGNRQVFLAVVGRNPYPQEQGRYIGKEWLAALNDCELNSDRKNIDTMLKAYYDNGSKVPEIVINLKG